MGTILLYGIMVVAFIAMLWANHQYKSKGVEWGRPLAGLCGILAVGMALYALYETQFKDDTIEIIEREQKYTQIGYKRLGEHIGSLHEGKNLLIIYQDFDTGMPADSGPTQNQIIMSAIETGVAGRLPITKVNLAEGIDMEDPEAAGMGMMDGMLTGEDFEKQLHENVPGYVMIKDDEEVEPVKEGDPAQWVVLSLLGLPMDAEPLPLWAKDTPDRPVLVLSNATLNGTLEHFRSGHIDAALSYNPNAQFNPDAKIPESESAAFDERWVLITSYNVDAEAEKYPEIFGMDPAAAPPAEKK